MFYGARKIMGGCGWNKKAPGKCARVRLHIFIRPPMNANEKTVVEPDRRFLKDQSRNGEFRSFTFWRGVFWRASAD
jgi:hypothetical protein